MSDTLQFIILFIVLVAVLGYIAVVYYRQRRKRQYEERWERDDDFRSHRGGGPR